MKSAVVLVLTTLAALLPLSADSHRAEAQSNTSFEELRVVVDALFAGDPELIEELLRFTDVACVEVPDELGGPPVCPSGVANGSPLEAMPLAGCEGGYALPNQLEPTVQALSTPGEDVLAIYHYLQPSYQPLFAGDFVVVHTVGGAQAPQYVGAVFVGDGGISGVFSGCETTLQAFSASFGVAGENDLTTSLPVTGKGGSTTTLEELRAAVDALFAGDPARIEELIRFKQVPCVEQPMGLEPLPTCPPGVTEGTLMDGFPRAQCEGRFFQPHELEEAIQALAEPGPQIVAVYPYPGSGHQSSLFYGDYVVVAALGPGSENARGIFVANGGIAGTDGGCLQDVETYVEFWGLGQPVDLHALSPALAPSTGGGSGGPSAPVALAVTLGVIAATLIGVALARRHA
jgi:hypothetical protein